MALDMLSTDAVTAIASSAKAAAWAAQDKHEAPPRFVPVADDLSSMSNKQGKDDAPHTGVPN